MNPTPAEAAIKRLEVGINLGAPKQVLLNDCTIISKHMQAELCEAVTRGKLEALAYTPEEKERYGKWVTEGEMYKEKQQELTKLRQQLQEANSNIAGYKSYLYGCSKHRLWQGNSCIGCMEQERNEAWREMEKVKTSISSLRNDIVGLYAYYCPIESLPPQKEIDALFQKHYHEL